MMTTSQRTESSMSLSKKSGSQLSVDDEDGPSQVVSPQLQSSPVLDLSETPSIAPTSDIFTGGDEGIPAGDVEDAQQETLPIVVPLGPPQTVPVPDSVPAKGTVVSGASQDGTVDDVEHSGHQHRRGVRAFFRNLVRRR